MPQPTQSAERAVNENTEEQNASAVLAALLRNHREFLSFLERRVGNRAEAEDILQDALARGLHKLAGVRDDALVVAWFYRVLRNALIDRSRRHGAKARALEKFASELQNADGTYDELHKNVCRCVAQLTESLKPEYRNALQRIEVDGAAVKDYAAEIGISSGNAAVRVFRAREALRDRVAQSCGACASDGCSACDCAARDA